MKEISAAPSAGAQRTPAPATEENMMSMLNYFVMTDADKMQNVELCFEWIFQTKRYYTY